MFDINDMTEEEYKNQLKLERYRTISSRTRYFTDVAKDTFFLYVKVFVGLMAGLIAILTAKVPLDLRPDTIIQLAEGIFSILLFVGVGFVFQIIFCLVRWYQHRFWENELFDDIPKPVWWAFIFEAIYIGLIIVSLCMAYVAVLEVKAYIVLN